MIKSVTIQNFRKVEDSAMSFGPGLALIRGSNEAGKSTRIEAIAYALYGSKVLRDTFAETVTHNKPESSLKVVLDLDLGGRQVTVKRSKGGAEVIEGGNVIVTGQGEVSTFITEALGADAKMASTLMFANQGNLRGALEQGPKEMALAIESLADFDLFDRLIESAQSKWMLGNTAVVEAQVAQAQQTLDGMEVPAAPDTATYERQIAALAEAVPKAEAESAALFKAFEDAQAEQARVTKLAGDFQTLQSRLAEEKLGLDALSNQAARLTAEAVIPVHDTKGQQALVDEAKAYQQTKAAWAKFQALRFPENYWEGSEDEYLAEWNKTRGFADGATVGKVEAEGKVRVLRQSKVTASICGFCGQDFTSIPEIAEKNAKIDVQIAELQESIARFEAAAKQAKAELFGFEAVQKEAKAYMAAASALRGYVVPVEGTWPPKHMWAGAALPETEPDVAALEATLRSMQLDVKKAEAAAAQLEVVERSHKTQADKIARLQAELYNLEVVGDEHMEVVSHQVEVARSAWSTGHDAYSNLSLRQSTLKREFEDVTRTYQDAVKRMEDAKKVLVEKQAMLKDMQFNNALLKKLRAARPVIADKLWHLVLGTVSNMFSRVRGEASVVAKGKDGFTVNGHSVKSLSGSTLDLLGLSLRFALTRTFMPNVDFVVLDEPFSAADADRTAAMLAFIQASGFKQTILVTHEELSTSIADCLIEI